MSRHDIEPLLLLVPGPGALAGHAQLLRTRNTNHAAGHRPGTRAISTVSTPLALSHRLANGRRPGCHKPQGRRNPAKPRTVHPRGHSSDAATACPPREPQCGEPHGSLPPLLPPAQPSTPAATGVHGAMSQTEGSRVATRLRGVRARPRQHSAYGDPECNHPQQDADRAERKPALTAEYPARRNATTRSCTPRQRCPYLPGKRSTRTAPVTGSRPRARRDNNRVQRVRRRSPRRVDVQPGVRGAAARRRDASRATEAPPQSRG